MKKISKISVLFCAFVLFFLVTPAVFAAPSISGVTGTNSQGNTVTISGTNFGTKFPAKPLIWAPFEGGNTAADASLSAGFLVRNSYQIEATTAANRPHYHSSYFVSNMAKTNGVKTAADMYAVVNTGNFYTFNRRKFPAGIFAEAGNFKVFWGGYDYVNSVWDYGIVGGQMCITFQAGNSREGWGQVGPAGSMSAYDNGEWQSWEIEEKRGSADAYDGVVRWWLNGVKKVDWLPKNNTTTYSSTTFPRVIISDFWTAKADGSGYLNNVKDYVDDVYLDSTWSRVMIGNASTFDASTHREPLIPTAWSASSITAYFNQGSFANGSQAYIFVVDSAGNASPGRAITINGTPPPSDTVAPAAPSGLSVQ